MPNDKTNKLPDDGDIKGPTPPTNPVEFIRQLFIKYWFTSSPYLFD